MGKSSRRRFLLTGLAAGAAQGQKIWGMPAGPARPPLPAIRPEEETELRALLERYKPVLSPL